MCVQSWQKCEDCKATVDLATKTAKSRMMLGQPQQAKENTLTVGLW